MYPNYLKNRKRLGYKAVKDTNCGIKLVLITDSTVQLISNLPVNVKIKSEKIIIVSVFAFTFWFSNLQPSKAIGLNMLPTPVVRLQPSYQHDSKVQIAKVIPRKKDLITYKSHKEILLLMYLTDPKISSNPRILRIVNQVRGGSGDWGLFSVLLALGIVIVILSASAATFIAPPPAGWGLDDRNPFQPPGGTHNYPPAYDLLQPRRTCFADRPGGSQIMSGMNPQSSWEELTQVSTDIVRNQTQISGFVENENGDVDLDKCYAEVIRRSESLNCENWSCDFERFKSLATENGMVSPNSAREAITVLNGEMLGFYTNAERVDYGKGIYGPDFKVIGQGEYSHVTHVEIKNPVGSNIEKESREGYTDIVQQGKKIGDKISEQQSKWSNATFRGSLRNLDPNAPVPQSPAHLLGLVDEFDVPISEKMIVQNAIENNCTNTSNVIFINNETNI